MYIIYDARNIKHKFSGLGRFTYSILLELLNYSNFDRLDIILEKNVDYISNDILNKIKEVKTTNVNLIYLDAPLFNMIKAKNIKAYINKKMPDIYFHPHFDLPFGIKANCKFVVHDVFSKKNFFHENEHHYVKDLLYGIRKNRFIKNIIFNNIIKNNLSKKNISCIAVSNATKDDLSSFVKKEYISKIKVVYEASFQNDMIKEKKVKLDLEKKRYLLYVGDRRPHKNLKRMIDIFDYISRNLDDELYFYIVGNQDMIYFDYDKYIKELNNIKIIQINNVSDQILNYLYSKAKAFFFLSKHEGFGLPLLEAAKHDINIITSDRSSLKEIAPSDSLLMSPYISVENGAKKIITYISTNNNDYSVYLKKFNWKKTMLEIFYETK